MPEPQYERYVHHGTEVSVRSDLKGRHRELCLCYGCSKFHPGKKSNCPIAKAVYDNCVKHDIVTPVFECPEFEAAPEERRQEFVNG